MGESDTTLQEILANLHEAQMEAFAVSVEAVLGAYKLATPAERLEHQEDLEQALIEPLLAQRSALLIDPALEDVQRLAGIPQIAHRLLQHHSNEALASSLTLDLNLEQLRSEFVQAPQ
ncbi:MAG: hypothetical protein QGG40_22470, partial [Myxococcota bacterium]|nr:hypothetical protein [Myxococcota bacterium]